MTTIILHSETSAEAYRLIYLCEKGVIVPDMANAKGRGSSRRFSSRNIFEFSVALVLGEFHIPAVLSRKIIYTLRSFQDQLGKLMPEINLPLSLTNSNAPQISLILVNGASIHFTINAPNKATKLLGAVDLTEPHQDNKISVAEINSDNFNDPLELIKHLPSSSSPAYLLVDLTRIASELPVE